MENTSLEHEFQGIPRYTVQTTVQYRAQNLRQGIVLKTCFKTRVSQMGLGSFVNINIFVMKYYFIQFAYILHFFRIS